MPVSAHCESCGRSYRILDKRTLGNLTCKECGGTISVTDLESLPDENEFTLAPLDHVERSETANPALKPAAAIMNPVKAGAGSLTCYNCGAGLPPKAVLCISCGMNLKTGRQLNTKSQGVDDQIDIGPPPGVWGICLTGAVLSCMISMGGVAVLSTAESPIGPLLVVLVSSTVFVNLLALVVRNKKRVSIAKRNGGKGIVTITNYRGFLKLKRTVDLGEYESIWFVQKPIELGTRTIMWGFALLLLLVGVVPGIIFWVALLNSDDAHIRYRAELRGDRKRKFIIYRGGEYAKADADGIVKMIHAATGLPKEQELGLID